MKVAVVWTRDHRKWKLDAELSSKEIPRLVQDYRSQKFLPIDIAGYVRTNADGKRSTASSQVWVESTGEENVELFAGFDRGEANLLDSISS